MTCFPCTDPPIIVDIYFIDLGLHLSPAGSAGSAGFLNVLELLLILLRLNQEPDRPHPIYHCQALFN